MRVQRGCVVHRCQNKNPRTRGCEWRHAAEVCTEDFGRFEKNQLVEFCLRGRRLTFTRLPWPCGRCRTWFGGDGKVCIERWYLSPYVKKPFSSKVISFVPELRSHKWFLCFGDSYVLCIYVMNILCTFHIFMYGYVTFTDMSSINFHLYFLKHIHIF